MNSDNSSNSVNAIDSGCYGRSIFLISQVITIRMLNVRTVEQNILTKPSTPKNWRRSMENDLHKLDIYGNKCCCSGG